MKGKLVAIGMIACFMLSLTASQASANALTENVLYAEGVDYLGLDAIATAVLPSVAIGEAKDVMVDWSDDIIYHQFPAGQKVRTEVLLHVVAVDDKGEYDPRRDGKRDETVRSVHAHCPLHDSEADR